MKAPCIHNWGHPNGGVSEWSKEAVLKTVDLRVRGFESHPHRQNRVPGNALPLTFALPEAEKHAVYLKPFSTQRYDPPRAWRFSVLRPIGVRVSQ